MFIFKINRIYIIDNHTWNLFYIYDVANVKIMSIVSDDSVSMDDIESWQNEVDETKKHDLLKKIVTSMKNVINFPEIAHVRDHDTIPFGESGYLIYHSDNIPEYLNWVLCVIKSNDDFRDSWAAIHQLITSDKLDKLAVNIAPLVNATLNPGFLISAEIARFTASLISEYLATKGDVQLGLLCQSLSRAEHYKYGDWKQSGVQDLTRNMTVDYSLFSYTIP
jgi:hypothetical protein